MTPTELKAFFIGIQSSEKPASFATAVLALKDSPDPVSDSETQLKSLWDSIAAGLKVERKKLMDVGNLPLPEKLAAQSGILDQFLFGFALGGLDFDDMKNAEASDLLIELEDHLMLLDEWVAEGESGEAEAGWQEAGDKYMRELQEIWAELQEALTP